MAIPLDDLKTWGLYQSNFAWHFLLFSIMHASDSSSDFILAPFCLFCCSKRAVGCIIAEMFGRKPMFPGKDFLHTLSLICRVVGTPDEETIARMPGLEERGRKYLRSIPYRTPISFDTLFPLADPLGIDLLEKLLVFE